MSINSYYGGIVYNTRLYGDTATSKEADDKIYQEFYLPGDYVRGQDVIPPISGIQILCTVETSYAATSAVDYQIDWYTNAGWTQLVAGTEFGAHVDGEQVWFDIYLDEPLVITEEMLTAKFRFGVESKLSDNPAKNDKVFYDRYSGRYQLPNGQVGYIYPYSFFPGTVQPINYYNYNENRYHYGYLYWNPDSGDIVYSEYHGITNFWYWPGDWRSYTIDDDDNEITVQQEAANAQLHFRLLAGVADTGSDIIGNDQRQVVTVKDAKTLDPFADKGENDFWMSKPNPSKFAVECLYFDMRVGNALKPQVIDKVSIDPITTGIYFSVYYSNEGEPGVNESSWEQKLWNRVPNTYLLDKKDTYVFPEPITAKYVCIEFTHLKAESYDPGETTFPITYKKHPKWVLDYFLSRLETDTTEDTFIASRVNISFDALDLAYNYFLDDLKQEPDTPVKLSPDVNTNVLKQFLTDRQDASDRVDPTTLGQIKLAFNRYARHPASNGPLDYIYTNYGPGAGNNYAVEATSAPAIVSTDVSSLNRQSLIIEQNYPVMFFYVPSRHTYREVSADLTYNRAYFAGIREIAFLRDNYGTQYDGNLYIEGIGDNTNVDRNDFFTTETFNWITHPE